MRFEPGESKTVQLCEIAGKKIISGGNGIATGPFDLSKRDAVTKKCLELGYAHKEQQEPPQKKVILTRDRDCSRFLCLGYGIGIVPSFCAWCVVYVYIYIYIYIYNMLRLLTPTTRMTA